MEIEIVKPQEIEKRSFEIIEEELKERGIVLPEKEVPITKRVIHTSADFSYAETMTYSPGAIEQALELIKGGAHIVTDTNMAKAGINKKTLARFGGQVHCFMADEAVAKEAKERGVTRAVVSMETAARLPGPVIFAIGNAPTALIELHLSLEFRSASSMWRRQKNCSLTAMCHISLTGGARVEATFRLPSAMPCFIWQATISEIRG